MLLRKVTLHVKEQNWFAVAIDFFIVIVGVFIGIQVANWNDERILGQQETDLLLELRAETVESVVRSKQKVEAYGQVANAARRSLKVIATPISCGSECWPILVDFMHASQWQAVDVARSTYDNMRRMGLPKDRNIVEMIELYLRQNRAASDAFSKLPYYRDLIRQIIPINAQEFYWKNCWSNVNGQESYDLECPKGVPDELAAQIVDKIVMHSEIQPHLTQWASLIVNFPRALASQLSAANKTVELIDAELKRR